jgi:ubiquinone/menaquinone biosynthesis C-methylase UbiE
MPLWRVCEGVEMTDERSEAKNAVKEEELTDRQRRELEYHRGHAAAVAPTATSIKYDVIANPHRKWWNAYWDIWTAIMRLSVKGKRVLVVGCGGGEDAFLFAKLGAEVSAFDLSPDMLNLGIARATKDGLNIDFRQMAAEKMAYPDNMFDIVFARDILHHVDIPATMKEIVRVAKPGAVFAVDEIYSHSVTDLIRNSWLVRRVLYPRLQGFIYKDRHIYITEDERKMSERDIAEVMRHVSDLVYHKYFNFLVTRIVHDNHRSLNKADRLLLMALGPLGYFCAGRNAFIGSLKVK